MKATVEAFPKPAFVLDGGGTVRYANENAARLFPATRPGDLFTLTFRWPEFSEALEIAEAGQAASVEFREPGETTNTYLVTLSPVSTPGGTVGFVLVTFDDVSDRLAIARMRADFVANASHELRTPLASLTGFIETLLGPARNDPATSEKFLHVMLDQARRMRRLIDDLLSLSRAEMRAHTPSDRPRRSGRRAPACRRRDAAARGGALRGARRSMRRASRSTMIGDRDELCSSCRT